MIGMFNHYHPPTLFRPEDFPQVTFSCTTTLGGAVSSFPVDVRRQDTYAQGDFGKWMIKHIDPWFAFSRSLGLGIEKMEDIVLVTGLHLTRSWANITFFESRPPGKASLEFEVMHGPDVSIKWHCSPGSVRGEECGTGAQKGRYVSSREIPRQHWHHFCASFRVCQRINDQRVFIRGFRVARIFGIFNCRGGLERQQDPSQVWTVTMGQTRNYYRWFLRRQNILADTSHILY